MKMLSTPVPFALLVSPIFMTLPTASYHAHTAPLLPCAQWQPPDSLARTMGVASWRQWENEGKVNHSGE